MECTVLLSFHPLNSSKYRISARLAEMHVTVQQQHPSWSFEGTGYGVHVCVLVQSCLGVYAHMPSSYKFTAVNLPGIMALKKLVGDVFSSPPSQVPLRHTGHVFPMHYSKTPTYEPSKMQMYVCMSSHIG